GLPLGRIADEPFALVGERDDRRGQPVAFLVRDNLGLAALHDRDDGIRRAEVNTNDLFAAGHCSLLSRCQSAIPQVKGTAVHYQFSSTSCLLEGVIRERGSARSMPLPLRSRT